MRVFRPDGTLVREFDAYDPGFRGGVTVAVADLEGTGRADIVTGAGPGGGPNVKVFGPDGSLHASFFAYDAGFTGGVHVTCGDRRPSLIATGPIAGSG